ncbi:MAG TPA: Gfo/Idh/MocA family oxidoreductase [Candidatus Brocadiia bacterium]|nr:Gfo/Idh/MocA family oxidoreductase [Candidatus Brocadiia bacterium]
MEPVKVALVGIGGMGGSHFRNIIENEMYQLVGVCDIGLHRKDVQERRKIAKDKGIPFFRDYKAMYRKVDCEAVFVAAPHHWHARMTIDALKKGCHVFTEKPPAGSTADVMKMIAAQKKAGKLVAVGFNPSASPAVQAVKRHIANGDLGTIKQVTLAILWWRENSYYRRAKWVGRMKIDGVDCSDGCMCNQGSHGIFQALYLASEKKHPSLSAPSDIEANLYRFHTASQFEAEDMACVRATLDGKKGKKLLAYITTDIKDKEDFCDIIGTKGRIRVGEPHIILNDGSKITVKQEEGVPSKQQNFALAIRGEAELYCPLEEGAKQVLLTDGAYASLKRKVKVAPWGALEDGCAALMRAVEQRCLISELKDKPDWA